MALVAKHRSAVVAQPRVNDLSTFHLRLYRLRFLPSFVYFLPLFEVRSSLYPDPPALILPIGVVRLVYIGSSWTWGMRTLLSAPLRPGIMRAKGPSGERLCRSS